LLTKVTCLSGRQVVTLLGNQDLRFDLGERSA
jgi:hypothetical protein